MQPRSQRPTRPLGRKARWPSTSRSVLLAVAGLTVSVAAVVTTLSIRSAPPSSLGAASRQSTQATQMPPADRPNAASPPLPQGSPRPKSREEWLAELKARTVRVPSGETSTTTPISTDGAKSEEDEQFELAHSIYEPVLGRVAANLKKLGAIRTRYEQTCTGVTVVEGKTEGTTASGESRVSGQVVGRGGEYTGITVHGTERVEVWVPPRRTTSTIRKADAPECLALALDANELAGTVAEARALAERAAIEKGVWTRVRAQVEEQVLDSLAASEVSPPR